MAERAIDKPRCTLCGDTFYIQIHHVSYVPEIIMPLCLKCHGIAHASGLVPRRPKGFIAQHTRYAMARKNKRYTTINLLNEVKDKLNRVKREGESYNDLIDRLVFYSTLYPLEVQPRLIRS